MDKCVRLVAAYEVVIIQEDPSTQSLDLTIRIAEHAHVTYLLAAPTFQTSARSITFILEGKGAQVVCSGAFMLFGNQHYSLNVVQDHQAPETTSSVAIKMVVTDHAQCLYTGKIMIQEHAVKSNGSQHHAALVVSPTAQVTSEPTLEVLTHDVMCNHGTAISYVNPEHLIYLMSRGISESEAKVLLIIGFLA